MINPKYLSTAEEPMLRELLRHFSIVVDPDLRERYLLVGALVVHLAEMEAAGLTSPAEYAAKLKSDEARKAARERMQRYRDKLRGKKPVTHVREQASPYAVTQTSEHTPQGYVTHVREQASPYAVTQTSEHTPQGYVTHVREQASPYAVTQTSEHTPQGYVTHVREQASPHVVMPTNEPLPPEM